MNRDAFEKLSGWAEQSEARKFSYRCRRTSKGLRWFDIDLETFSPEGKSLGKTGTLICETEDALGLIDQLIKRHEER